MFEDIETHKKLSKWIIGTFTACILIAKHALQFTKWRSCKNNKNESKKKTARG